MMVSQSGDITPETAGDKYLCGNLAYACAASPKWPVSVRFAVRAEREALLGALELYEALERGTIHETSVYPELAGHPEAKHEALELAGQAVWDLTAELVAVFPACALKAESEVAA